MSEYDVDWDHALSDWDILDLATKTMRLVNDGQHKKTKQDQEQDMLAMFTAGYEQARIETRKVVSDFRRWIKETERMSKNAKG